MNAYKVATEWAAENGVERAMIDAITMHSQAFRTEKTDSIMDWERVIEILEVSP